MHPQSTAPIPRAFHKRTLHRIRVPHIRGIFVFAARVGYQGTQPQSRLFNLSEVAAATESKDRVPSPSFARAGYHDRQPPAPTVYSTQQMIRILGTTFAGLLGLAFGSFLNTRAPIAATATTR
jgi:hypothetical protein